MWLVREDRTGLKFALKCFDRPAGRDRGDDPMAGTLVADGIRREIRILSVLDHPHLVRAQEAVMVRRPDGEHPALLMDYAAGGSVASLVAARAKLTVGETVTVLTPIAEVLDYLHGKGMTHSDVSPGNVLFTGQGKPLLADLGITRMVGDPGRVPRGTPGFSDPSPVDAARAGLHPEGDVYAAAAVGWYCLTGSPPPRSAVRPPLALLRPDVPREMAAALEAGLNEDRRRRPRAAELAAAVYGSAEPLPVDLAPAVHPSVIPELLTRRHVPAKQGSVLRKRPAGHSRAWAVHVPGLRRRMTRLPFPDAAPGPARAPGLAPTRGRHAGQRKKTGLHGKARSLGPRGGIPHHDDAPAGTGGQRPSGIRLWAVGVLALAAAGGLWVSSHGLALPINPPAAAGTASQQHMGRGTGVWAEVPADAVPGSGTGEGPLEADIEAARKVASAADPAKALAGLAALRSLAFSLGRPELLDEVNRTGSSADAADRKTSQQLLDSGTVLEGFTANLSGVEVEAGATGSRAIVRATSAASAYEERDAAGAVLTAVGAGPPRQLRLVLVSDAGRWLISEILPGE